MGTKGLGNETLVTSILRSNTVLVEVGGSVRRITVENFMNAINNGDEQMLRQVAWGIPIKQSTQSSTNYGVIGNTAAWTEYKLYCGRYLVTNDGRAAKMSPTNSAVFADGTAVDETKGHVMWIGPRLYYRVQTDSVSGVPVLWLSMLPIGGEFIGGQTVECITVSVHTKVPCQVAHLSRVQELHRQAVKQSTHFGLLHK